LIATGRYERPALGIGMDENWNKTITQHLDLEGIAVLQVSPGSGAEAAGLRPAKQDRSGNVIVGDIIVEIDGKAVKTPGELLSRLDEKEIGDTVRLTLIRDGKRANVDIKLQGAQPRI
jgi:S1-C subfamily serine protease